MRFNERSINSLTFTGSPRKYADTGQGGVQGLHMRVSKNAKTWTYRYRFDGKAHWQKLGEWPACTIGKAREKARDFATQLEDGFNPKAIGDSAPKATFGELLDAYFRDLQKRDAKSIKCQAVNNARVQEKYRVIPASEVTPAVIHGILHHVAVERGTPTLANRVRTFISSAFNWAVREEYNPLRQRNELSFGVAGNPARDVPKIASAERPSSVELTMEQAAAVWVHADDYNSVTTSLAAKFHIACGGIRMFDSLHRRWDGLQQIEHEGELVTVIVIPNDKMGRERVVPLGRHALEIIEELRAITGDREVMFPARSSNTQPISTIAVGQMTRKLQTKYPVIGDYSSRYIRKLAATELNNAGVDRLSIDKLHGRFIKSHNPVSERHYFRGHDLHLTLPVVREWDSLLDQAVEDYVKKFESGKGTRASQERDETCRTLRRACNSP
ncbi:MAG: integrase family protein [Pseudomonadota bacterium]